MENGREDCAAAYEGEQQKELSTPEPTAASNSQQHVEEIRRLIRRIAASEEVCMHARRFGTDGAGDIGIGQRMILALLRLQTDGCGTRTKTNRSEIGASTVCKLHKSSCEMAQD